MAPELTPSQRWPWGPLVYGLLYAIPALSAVIRSV